MEDFLGFLGKRGQVFDKMQLNIIWDRYLLDPSLIRYHFSYDRFSIGVAYRKDSSPKIIETSRFFFFASGRFDNVEFGQLFKEKDLYLDSLFSTKFDALLWSIRGDFILVLYDKKVKKLICVRDQLGMRPFYFTNNEQYFSFTSDIGLFKKIPEFSFTMDDQWIADSVSRIRSEKFRTPYEGIHRLVPGNTLEVGNKHITKPYWNPSSNEDYSSLDFRAATDQFSEKFDVAVKRRIRGSNVLGCELSGGLDSSGVTAYVLKNSLKSNSSLFAFSHVLSEEGVYKKFHYQDESKFSTALVQALNIQDHILCSGINNGILSTIKNTILIQGIPSQATYHFFSDILLGKAKQNGVERLFSGFGGDEGVSSKAAGFFHELFLLKHYDLFRNECQNYLGKKGFGAFRSNLLCEGYYHLNPYVEYFKGFKTKRRKKAVISSLDVIDKHFFELMCIKKRVSDKFILHNEDTVRNRQISQVMQDHISHRLESSYLAAKSHGIEYVYPLWDIDLLQFYLDLPIGFKYREGMGRAVYRESLKGLVPESIRMREDKIGRTIPTARYRMVEDYTEIERLILRCKNNNRYHYIDYQNLLSQLNLIRQYSKGKKVNLYRLPGFINTLQILLLQDMQRSEEFDSGIRL